MKNKKITAIILITVMLITVLCSCRKEEEIVLSDTNIVVDLDTMLELCNDSWTFTELITRLYPKYVAYTKEDGSSIGITERFENLPANTYDFNKVSVNSDGFRVYDPGNPESECKVGIDVSAFQYNIDWEQVAESGVDFAIIRLGYRGNSEGGLLMDQCFERNVEGALANGIEVGVYFVTQAISEQEAKEEAKFVLNAIKGYDITWPVVLDVEASTNPDARTNNVTSEERTAQIDAFCKKIKNAGYTPMIYSNVSWYLTKMDISKLADYDFWIAYYKPSVYFPYDFKLWQYSCTGNVPGIDTEVDLDLSFIDYGKKGQ